MNTIADAAKQMGALIDDLLTFSRLGQAELRTGSVSLDQLAREAVEGLIESSVAKGMRGNVPIPHA